MTGTNTDSHTDGGAARSTKGLDEFATQTGEVAAPSDRSSHDGRSPLRGPLTSHCSEKGSYLGKSL